MRGSGDGGIYSTLQDVTSFWRALFAGRIVPAARVGDLMRPRSDIPEEDWSYGLGFWLAKGSDAAMLEGSDAGVSFRSVHDPTRQLTYTVMSNTTEGAWPIARLLKERLAS